MTISPIVAALLDPAGSRSAATSASSGSTPTSSWRSRRDAEAATRACAPISRAARRAARSTTRSRRSSRSRGGWRRMRSAIRPLATSSWWVAASPRRLRQHAARGGLRRQRGGRLRRAAPAVHAAGSQQQVLRGEKPPAAALWRPASGTASRRRALAGARPRRDRSRRAHRGTWAIAGVATARSYSPRAPSPGASPSAPAPRIASTCCARSPTPTGSARTSGAGTRWLVIGGGFIGAEFAASAALTGSDVSLVMPQEVILEARLRS